MQERSREGTQICAPTTGMELLLCILQCAGAGVVGGLLFVAQHATMEFLWHHFLLHLHSKGFICRLAPSIQATMVNYQKESFWAVALPNIPLAAGIFLGRDQFIQHSKFELDILGSFLFTWTIMVLHDFYFFLVHTLLHKCKAAYTRIHQHHHTTKGEITVFSTAYGSMLDVVFEIVPFYSTVALWLCYQEHWNPLHIMCLSWAMHGVNLMGHCGYDLPPWVFVPGSLGVLLTPMAQRPIHHYIHHLDPRFNRSLYFTWWDKLAGTLRESHPKVTNVKYQSGLQLNCIAKVCPSKEE